MFIHECFDYFSDVFFFASSPIPTSLIDDNGLLNVFFFFLSAIDWFHFSYDACIILNTIGGCTSVAVVWSPFLILHRMFLEFPQAIHSKNIDALDGVCSIRWLYRQINKWSIGTRLCGARILEYSRLNCIKTFGPIRNSQTRPANLPD